LKAKERSGKVPAMRLSLFGLLIGILFSTGASAQELVIPKVTYPTLPKEGANAEAFVPIGWKLEKQQSGDLNKDGQDDLLLLLRMNNPGNVVKNEGLGQNPFDTNPRILAVAFGNGAGKSFTLGLENYTLIARTEDPVMDDPVGESGGVAIERGTLKVDLYSFASAGSWSVGTTSFRFRSGKRGFELIGYDSSSTQRNSGEVEQVSINYLTGKVQISTGTISDDKLKDKWRKIPKKKLLLLEEIGDGLAFDPGIGN
jgi:hypothetical protein